MKRTTAVHYAEREDRWEVSIKSFLTKRSASLVEGERQIIKIIRVIHIYIIYYNYMLIVI